MKKLVSFLLILTLLLTVIPATTAQATVKLNKTSLSLNEGGSFRLSITGTTKTIKWSSSNKAVATVSSRGTVKAVKEGNATITATVSSKKYSCKVKVKDVLTNEEAAEKISYEVTELNDELLLVMQNKNNVNLELKVEATYYDNSNLVLSTSSSYIWVFEAGKKAVVTLTKPYDDNYNPTNFNRYEIKLTVELEYVSPDKVIDNISLESNKGSKNLIVTATNNSDDDISSAEVHVLYYQGNIIVGHTFGYISDIASGESVSKEFSEPYDENYDTLPYDDYEIIINEARFE